MFFEKAIPCCFKTLLTPHCADHLMPGEYLGRNEGEFYFCLLTKLLSFFIITIDLARNVRYYLLSFRFFFFLDKVYLIRRMMGNVQLDMAGN